MRRAHHQLESPSPSHAQEDLPHSPPQNTTMSHHPLPQDRLHPPGRPASLRLSGLPALFVHNPSLSFPPPTGSPSMSSVNPLKSAVVPAAQPECSLHLCDFTETRLVPEDNTSLLYTPLTCSSHLSQKQRTRGQGQGLPVPPPFTPMTLEAWPSQPPASHQASKSFPATDQGLHL